MFILLTIGLFVLKFLALGVIGLFLAEDLELTSHTDSTIYMVYMATGIAAFIGLFFFVLGKKLLWLIIFVLCAAFYLGMYNNALEIKEIHQNNDLKSRYFQDTGTFLARMQDVFQIIN